MLKSRKYILAAIALVVVFCSALNKSYAVETIKKSSGTENKEFSDTVKDIANHLEFLGYKIERIQDDGKPYVIAYHETKHNIIIRESYPDFTYLSSIIYTEKPYSPAMAEFMNKLIPTLNLTNGFVTQEKDSKLATLTFVSIYTGKYSKKVFGNFIDMYDNDINKMQYAENYSNIFLK